MRIIRQYLFLCSQSLLHIPAGHDYGCTKVRHSFHRLKAYAAVGTGDENGLIGQIHISILLNPCFCFLCQCHNLPPEHCPAQDQCRYDRNGDGIPTTLGVQLRQRSDGSRHTGKTQADIPGQSRHKEQYREQTHKGCNRHTNASFYRLHALNSFALQLMLAVVLSHDGGSRITGAPSHDRTHSDIDMLCAKATPEDGDQQGHQSK